MTVGFTPLGLGTAQLGNLYSAMDDETATAVVRAAYEAGLRFFDTAPHYGLGLSERRLGAALAGLPRASYVVSTKVGRLLVPDPDGANRPDPDDVFVGRATHRRVWDFSADGVRRSLADSLDRLGMDRIDVVLLHDPEEADDPDQAIREAWPVLAELRASGTIAAIGAGAKRADVLADFVRRTDPDLVILAGRYTLLEQGALDDLLPLCVERAVAVVVAGVFNSGLLATDRPAVGNTYEYRPASAEVLERARRLAGVCAANQVPLPAAAMQFPHAHPAVESVLVGCHSAAQVLSNVELSRRTLPAGLWAQLRADGLLRPDAPTPEADL